MSYEDFPCEQAVAMVTDYLEGGLDVQERAVLERHLAWCEWCVTYFDQIKQTIRALGSAPAEEVPPPVMDRLLAAYREVHAR